MKLLVTLGAFLFSGIVSAAPLHNIIVFGDSLSDNGNLYEFMKHQLPQSPPYFEGRFSNGPVWVEHVAAKYFPKNTSAHLINYAFGGSGVSEEDDDDVLFTLRKQVSSYLLSNNDKAQDDSLYVVWIGANNYLGLPSDIEKTITDVNSGITNSLELLVSKGARHIMVFNLPNLGKTPAAVEFDAADVMSYFAIQHNQRLEQTMDGLKQTHPEVEWVYFDLGAMFDDVLNNPAKYGFTHISGSCSNSVVDELSKKSILNMVARVTPKLGADACDGYVFFDLVHPTALAHKLIAEKVILMLDEAGIVLSE